MIKASRKKHLIKMAGAGLIFGLCFGIGSGMTSLIVTMARGDTEPQEAGEEVLEQDGERTNILLLGVDARPGEEASRSDTMILVSVDPKIDKTAVVSIPRDTRVTIRGAAEKICAANILGGPELAVSTVEDLMNINVDYWVEMDFKGFARIVDTLGGVTVTVPQRMYVPLEGIDLQPGTRKLDGADALGFVRYRAYALGDIERTRQQQVFIRALADEVLKPKTIAKLPQLSKDLNKYVKTNMKVTDMLRMASWAPGFKAGSIITQTLPGSYYDVVDENGCLLQSYWQADKKQAAVLLENMFRGETIAVVQNAIKDVVPSARSSGQEEEQMAPEEPKDKEPFATRTPAPKEQAGKEEALPGSAGDPVTTGSDQGDVAIPPAASPVSDIAGPEGYI